MYFKINMLTKFQSKLQVYIRNDLAYYYIKHNIVFDSWI